MRISLIIFGIALMLLSVLFVSSQTLIQPRQLNLDMTNYSANLTNLKVETLNVTGEATLLGGAELINISVVGGFPYIRSMGDALFIGTSGGVSLCFLTGGTQRGCITNTGRFEWPYPGNFSSLEVGSVTDVESFSVLGPANISGHTFNSTTITINGDLLIHQDLLGVLDVLGGDLVIGETNISTMAVSTNNFIGTDGKINNLTVIEFNNILYTLPNNISDIQAKIDMCNGIDLCNVIISHGKYTSVPTLQLKSNLIIDATTAEISSNGVLYNGTDLSNVVIQGGKYTGTFGATLLSINGGDNIVIKDILGVDSIGSGNQDGLQLYNVNNFAYLNNKQLNGRFAPIFVSNSSNGEISGNHIQNTSNDAVGIQVTDGSHDIIISGNIDEEGISLQGNYSTHPEFNAVYNIKVVDNTVNDVENDGISAWNLVNSIISDNIVTNTVKDCIVVRDGQGSGTSSYNVDILNNLCDNNGQYGISLVEYGGLVQGNSINDSACGIYVWQPEVIDNGTNYISGNFIQNVRYEGAGILIRMNGTIVEDNVIYRANTQGINLNAVNVQDVVVRRNKIISLTRPGSTTYGIDVGGINNTIEDNSISDDDNTGLLNYGLYIRSNGSYVKDNVIKGIVLTASIKNTAANTGNNYINNYEYSGDPSTYVTCKTNTYVDGQMMHNSSNVCVCTGGLWKCWVIV